MMPCSLESIVVSLTKCNTERIIYATILGAETSRIVEQALELRIRRIV